MLPFPRYCNEEVGNLHFSPVLQTPVLFNTLVRVFACELPNEKVSLGLGYLKVKNSVYM